MHSGSGTKRGRGRVVAIVVLDIAMLIELAVAMYFANQRHSDFTVVFLKTFFGLLIPTLLLWRQGVKKILSNPCDRKAGGGLPAGEQP